MEKSGQALRRYDVKHYLRTEERSVVHDDKRPHFTLS